VMTCALTLLSVDVSQSSSPKPNKIYGFAPYGGFRALITSQSSISTDWILVFRPQPTTTTGNG